MKKMGLREIEELTSVTQVSSDQDNIWTQKADPQGKCS